MTALHLEGRIIAADEWIKAAGFYPDYVTLDYMIRQKLTMIQELTMLLFKVRKRLKTESSHNTYILMNQWRVD